MSIYERFLQERKQHENLTDREAAAIIYELVASDPRADVRFGIDKEHHVDEFLLYGQEDISVYLQATKHKNGKVELSIQGVSNPPSGLRGYFRFFNRDEQPEFLKHLIYF